MRLRTIVAIFACFLLALTALQAQVRIGENKKEKENKPTATEDNALALLQGLIGSVQMYADIYPDEGFPCALVRLADKPGEEPNKDHAGLITDEMASGDHARYRWTLMCPDIRKPRKKFRLVAMPKDFSLRTYCVDETNVIRSVVGNPAKCFAEGEKIR